MITVKVRGCSIGDLGTVTLASGSKNSLEIQFLFSDEWKNYEKTAVFQAAQEERGAPLDKNDKCKIPWELLTEKAIGQKLFVAVKGVRFGGSILNSVYTGLGTVERGASGNPPPIEPPGPDEPPGEMKEAILQFKTYFEFPTFGELQTLYVDATENKSYRWDETENRYFVVGSDYEQIKIIDGGAANG